MESNADRMRALMALPVADPERQKLPDAVPYSAKQLEARCRKFLSRSPEFWVNRAPQWWNVTEPDPVYPGWTKRTRQSTPRPFESGPNVLPGLEQFWRAAKREGYGIR
jgi:hypothetical protein